ncbi:MAG: DNA helicase UvrD [Candidatus Portnoybacteria bacterium]|nr:DNA helicase UvrD [Candidatus Portnoybacteria bacterium]
MKYIADLHIHSKYSLATSKNTNIQNLTKQAKIKGVDILGTGDFTHPLWLKELKRSLEPAEPGLFKPKKLETRYILSAEISSIYSKNDKTRKIHNIILAPSFKIVEKINRELKKIGNLKSDGRPILKLDAKELAKIVLNASKDCLIIPAHIWTPWYSLLGSKSGFNSIEECFEEYTKYIYAVETGLSADPEMCWKCSFLDKTALISNSDSHSPKKIGREATLFEGNKISYNLIRGAIKNASPNALKKKNKKLDLEIKKTIEFFPQEGKYHWDGHRKCDISLNPEQSLKYNNICPRCGKPLTIGVMNRVLQLADRKTKPKHTTPFQKLIPLEDIIIDSLNVKSRTKKAEEQYNNLINNIGNEISILTEAKIEDIKKASTDKIGEGIERARKQNIFLQPGYDGEFGKIDIFKDPQKQKTKQNQNTLF